MQVYSPLRVRHSQSQKRMPGGDASVEDSQQRLTDTTQEPNPV